MTNVNHDLRHDKDNVMLFTRQDVTDIIPFDPAWVESEGPCAGLPTKVGAWINEHIEVGKTVVGVRWLNFHSYSFQMTRFNQTFVAEFRMPDKRIMKVMPGNIEISRYEPSNELLVRYIEFKVDGGTTWKAWFETKRRYDYNYHDCPKVMSSAFSLIDNLLYEITKVPHLSIARFLYGLTRDDRPHAAESSVPQHLLPFFTNLIHRADIETPVEIEKFYSFLTKHYYYGNGESVPLRANAPDLHLYTAFQTILGSFLHGRELDRDPFAVYKMHLLPGQAE